MAKQPSSVVSYLNGLRQMFVAPTFGGMRVERLRRTTKLIVDAVGYDSYIVVVILKCPNGICTMRALRV